MRRGPPHPPFRRNRWCPSVRADIGAPRVGPRPRPLVQDDLITVFVLQEWTDGRLRGAVSPSKRYLGFVDVADVATVMVTKGLKRHASHGILAKIARLCVPDEDHTVRLALNVSGMDGFHTVSSTATLAQVRWGV